MDKNRTEQANPVKSDRVCAVVVTYNRGGYLMNLLEALLRQTHPLAGIFIFDNLSSDNTVELLKENGYIDAAVPAQVQTKIKCDCTVYYYRNTENSGGAGGFCGGMKLASQLDVDHLWMMDDDVLPEPDCLEKLLEQMSPEVGITLPSRTDERNQDYAVTKFDLSNPFLYTIRSRKTMVRSQDILGDTMAICDMPFEGPLISLSVIRQVGFPREDMFIIFDDTEYAHRASQVTRILYCKRAVLHRQIIPASAGKGKQMVNWKNYYGYRNQFWFDKTYGKNVLVRYLRPFLLFADHSLRFIVTGRFANLKVMKRAYVDGMQEKLGKRIEPGTPGEKF